MHVSLYWDVRVPFVVSEQISKRIYMYIYNRIECGGNLIYDLRFLLPWNQSAQVRVQVILSLCFPLYFPIRASKRVYNRFRVSDKTFRTSVCAHKVAVDFIESSGRLRSSKPPTLVTWLHFSNDLSSSVPGVSRIPRRVIKYLSNACIYVWNNKSCK